MTEITRGALPFSYRCRPEALAAAQSRNFDLLVVGGGITGAGIARDAALRGLSVLLVEKGDFASGTSSKSSKLVHGGLRYLEQLEFALVFEAQSERQRLARQAPHLVRPLPFVFPIFEGDHHGPFKVSLGMWLYDALSLFRNFDRHRRLTPAESALAEPRLRREGLRASMQYYDAATDDGRLTLENAIAAHEAGATLLTYTTYLGPIERGGRVVGAKLRCSESGAEWTTSADCTVVSAGPWTNGVRATLPESAPMVRPTKGVHVVVPRERLPVSHAVVMASPMDGRVVFALPWEESTAIGTTDTDFHGGPDDVTAEAADVRYLLETTNAYFPTSRLSANDVLSTWAGLRPLVRDDADSPYATSREHTICPSENGVVTIAGGKLTTYRKMAEECVDAVVALLPRQQQEPLRPCSTAHGALPGGEGLFLDREVKRASEVLDRLGVRDAAAVGAHLVHLYGARWERVLAAGASAEDGLERVVPDLPVLWAQVDYAVESELALTLSDVLVRRTHIHYHDAQQGLAVAERVAQRMAGILQWSPARTLGEVKQYRALVESNAAWRAAWTLADSAAVAARASSALKPSTGAVTEELGEAR
jgi:glycerol-3-phosphate dehydrogenase